MTTQFNAGLAYSDFKQRQFFYILAAFVAFTMSSYFVVGYLAGSLHPWTWDSGQWMNAFVGIGITAVMTGYQFVLYSQGNVDGGKKATIIAVCVAVGFSLLSEIGQGMERDNIRMETKSQESPTYKAAVAALGNLSGSSSIGASPYAADIASAQMKYNQCMERLAKGKEPHCEGSRGRLESYQQQEAAWSDRASATSTNTASALLDKAKWLEKDETNYHPLVNLIRETFGASGTVGSFLLSLVLISFFEYAFHYLGGAYAKAREYLMQNGYDVTRRLRQPPRKHDGSISTYSDNAPTPLSAFKDELRGMVDNAPAAIANEYARAQHARQQVYSKAADKLDAIQDGLNQKVNSQIEDDNRLFESGGKQTPEQREWVLNEHARRNGKTYRQELAEGEKAYSDQPLDKPRPAPRLSVEATVKQIHADVKASGAKSPEAIQAAVFDAFAAMPHPAPFGDDMLNKIAERITASAPAMPINQKPGGTGLQNPALGTAEEQHEMKLPVMTPGLVGKDSRSENSPTPGHDSRSEKPGAPGTENRALPVMTPGLDADLLAAIKDAQGQIPADVLKEAAGLYPVWKGQVQNREIKPTKRDGFRFISANLCRGNRTRTLTPEHMVMLLNIWQARAARDGLLIPNPDYSNGKAKFLLAA